MASKGYARYLDREQRKSSPNTSPTRRDSALRDSMALNNPRTVAGPASTDLQKALHLSSQTLVTVEDRVWAIDILLQHLHSVRAGEAAALPTLQAIKLFGRVTQGSAALARADTLTLLLHHAHILPNSASLPKDLSLNAMEAWRILCNAIKLHEKEAVQVLQDIDGAIQGILYFMHDPAPKSAHFFASRLLFLLTIKGGEVNRTLVEDCGALDVLYEAIHKAAMNASNLDSESIMALADQLKLLYNLALFYPRILAIDPKENMPIDYTSIQSTPDLSRLAPSEKGSVSSSLGRGLKHIFSKSPSGSSGSSSRPTSPAPSVSRSECSTSQRKALPTLAIPLIDLILSLPNGQFEHPYPSPPLTHALHALSELPSTSEWSKGSSSISNLPSTSTASASNLDTLPLLLGRLLQLLNQSMQYTFPEKVDPDDSANRSRLLADSKGVRNEAEVDSELAPLLLMIRKAVIGDESGRSRRGLRERLLSSSMDRSIPLDQRPDLTGILVRLMGSVYFGNTKIGASELLFALCDQDPEEFAATIGYGPTAGFLASNQMLAAPSEPKASKTKSKAPNGTSSQPFNPITGAYERPNAGRSESDMTEEEKEQEAERLFVLFDRLAKTGVMNVENPIQKAQQSGRFQEVHDEEEDQHRVREEEDADEREAIEEMRRWKNRRGGNASK